MIYFTLHQDKRVINAPELMFAKKDLEELKTFPTPENLFEPKVVYVRGALTKKIDYPDLIEAPVMLISEKLKPLVNQYQKNIWMRTVFLTEEQGGGQEVYYAIYVPKLRCASKQSVYSQSRQLKEFVLNETQVGSNRIFVAKERERKLIVRLDVAESMLRRKVNGLVFEEIKNGVNEVI